MHGDEFDAAVKFSPWLARLGGGAYALAMWLNRGVNACRRALGLPYWSLASYLKPRLGNAVRYVEHSSAPPRRRRATRPARRDLRSHPSRRDARDRRHSYCNDGDWVESCTALVEDMNERTACRLCAAWTQRRAGRVRRQGALIEVAAVDDRPRML